MKSFVTFKRTRRTLIKMEQQPRKESPASYIHIWNFSASFSITRSLKVNAVGHSLNLNPKFATLRVEKIFCYPGWQLKLTFLKQWLGPDLFFLEGRGGIKWRTVGGNVGNGLVNYGFLVEQLIVQKE